MSTIEGDWHVGWRVQPRLTIDQKVNSDLVLRYIDLLYERVYLNPISDETLRENSRRRLLGLMYGGSIHRMTQSSPLGLVASDKRTLENENQ